MLDIKDKLIVALDVDSFEKAKELVDKLYPAVKIFKVGSQLFTACGPETVKMIQQKGARVFLDLKFYDIPQTVAKTVAVAMRLKVFMLTLHIQGGLEMMQRARDALRVEAKNLHLEPALIIGITVLTSEKKQVNMKSRVLALADLAKEAGLDGVVCSAQEATTVRKACGEDFIIVTPSIRPKDYPSDDQKRTATAKEAIKAGADYIVVGRPIIQAADPLAVAKEIIQEIIS